MKNKQNDKQSLRSKAKKALMHIKIWGGVILLMANTAYSQDSFDSIPSIDSNVINSFIEYNSELKENVSDIEIDRKDVLFYQDHAELFIKFNEASNLSQKIIIKDVSNDLEYVKGINANILLTTLELDKEYDIVEHPSRKRITRIETRQDTGSNMISLSTKPAQAINKYLLDEIQENIFDYLWQNSEIDIIEYLKLYQAHALRHDYLPAQYAIAENLGLVLDQENSDYSVFLSTDYTYISTALANTSRDVSRKTDCGCDYIKSEDEAAYTDGKFDFYGYDYYYGTERALGHSLSSQADGEVNFDIWDFSKGASTMFTIWNSGTNSWGSQVNQHTHYDRDFEPSTGPTTASSKWQTLNLQYVCTDETFGPEDCSCMKRVHVGSYYALEAWMTNDLISYANGYAGNSLAMVTAASVWDSRTKKAYVIDEPSAFEVKNNYKVTFNSNFIGGLSNIANAFSVSIKDGAWSIGSFDMGKLFTGITAVLTNPLRDQDGQEEFGRWIDQTLLNGQNEFELHPNQFLHIRLNNFLNMVVSGRKKWYNHVSGSTYGGIIALIRRGGNKTSNDRLDALNCCSEQFAIWNACGLGHDQDEAINDAFRSYLSSWTVSEKWYPQHLENDPNSNPNSPQKRPTVYGNVHKIWGPKDPSCTDSDGIDIYSAEQFDINNAVSVENGEVIITLGDEEGNYKIRALTGQVLQEGSVTKGYNYIGRISQAQLAAGIYIVELITPNDHQTLKIYVQ